MNVIEASRPRLVDVSYTVKLAAPEDAAETLTLFQRVRAESPYLLLEPTEGIQDVKAQERQLLSMQTERKQVIFLALHLERPVGFVGVSRGGFRRNRHTASLAIALEAAHQRKGLGAWLIGTAIRWSKCEGIRRLELTVSTENLGAIKLYKAHGFTIEGFKRMSFMIDEQFVDEHLMALILDDFGQPTSKAELPSKIADARLKSPKG